MATQVVIIFPYGGLKSEIQKAIFEKIVECSSAATHGRIAILVIEEATKNKMNSSDWEELAGDGRLEILSTWSVDTCQRWLIGWGYVLEKSQNDTDRIVLLPGDIERIGDIDLKISQDNNLSSDIIERSIARAILTNIYELSNDARQGLETQGLETQYLDDIDRYLNNIRIFFQKLRMFIEIGNRQTQGLEIVIGDYQSQPHSAKELIDIHGTFPLIANWFRGAFRQITNNILDVNDPSDRGLSKPRSEFLNIRKDVLKKLLETYTPFAYEQTLNMIVRWYIQEKRTDGIYKFKLGVLHDDKTLRKFRNCVDQIERTERMLRFIWRQIEEPKRYNSKSDVEYQNAYHDFMKDYSEHDRRSTAIREAANIALENFLI